MRQAGSSHGLTILVAAAVWSAGMTCAGAQPAQGQAAPGAPQPVTSQTGSNASALQQPPVASGCDAACVRANNEIASQMCAPKVEAEAPTDYEWVSRPFAKIFQQAEAPEGTATVVRYRGDSIRFLSPQKEWVRVTYECGFDAAKKTVAYVRVRLGRLDKAEAPPPPNRPPQPQPVPQAQQQALNPQQTAPKRILPSEPSEIEVRQVRPSHRQALQ